MFYLFLGPYHSGYPKEGGDGMRLTPDEIKKIDAALEPLKRSLKDEYPDVPKEKAASFNNEFLDKAASKYLSATGIINLLADARLQDDQNISCVCGCQCSEPTRGPISY
jgi:hypothetical protein